MSRLVYLADRLANGSAAVARGFAARTAAWIARGRREDLGGWRASLGCWARLAGLTLMVWLLWRLVRAVPLLLSLLSAAWIVAAWRAGKPTSEAATTPENDASAVPPVEAVRALLLDVMGDAPAVQLRTVLAHLQRHGQWEGRTVTDLRAHLGRLDIPVDRNVKVAGTPTWGVRRKSLETPSPAVVQETPAEPSTAA